VDVGMMHVPFRFRIAVQDGQVAGWFFNGSERVVSSKGTFENGHLVLEFPTYARRLDATLAPDGALAGTYLPTTPKAKSLPYPFHAQHAQQPAADANPPAIAGLWLMATKSEKAGEHAWRLLVRQSGASVSAAVLRVDGDSGELTGTWHNGKLLLSHFDGARPSVYEVAPGTGGTLQVLVRDRDGADQTLMAYRAEHAQEQGVPEAADPALHTSIKDPAVPFQFSFPDLDGHVVSSTDSRFHGKVLVVDIGGSWCPNCHDEAPFLEELYKKYHARGLEVVTLSFEEPEQLVNPTRLRAFIQHYGIDYTVLVAGAPDDLHSKIPQAVNLDAYPTTFFIGRDGRVRAVHAGFAAATTGDFNARLKKDFTQRIEELLAEKPPSSSRARGQS
jgi:thiol-disulfide isomerase/thioredoxin